MKYIIFSAYAFRWKCWLSYTSRMCRLARKTQICCWRM